MLTAPRVSSHGRVVRRLAQDTVPPEVDWAHTVELFTVLAAMAVLLLAVWFDKVYR
jgi:hypothetical protein